MILSTDWHPNTGIIVFELSAKMPTCTASYFQIFELVPKNKRITSFFLLMIKSNSEWSNRNLKKRYFNHQECEFFYITTMKNNVRTEIKQFILKPDSIYLA